MDVGIAEKDYDIDFNSNLGLGSEKKGFGVNRNYIFLYFID